MLGVLALGAAAVAIGGLDVVLLAGSVVVGSGELALAVWGLAVLLAAVLVGAVVLPRRGILRGPLGLATMVLLGAGIICSGVWTVGAALVAAGAAGLNSVTWTVLRPPAGTGCAVVGSEGHAIATSGGEIYLVDRLGLGRPLTTWSGDDVQRPFEQPGTGVAWHGDGGTLRLDGDRRPISPSRVDFTCPA